MKSKLIRVMVPVFHVAVLAVFSLMQGCTTGDCPIPWLNWPFSTPQDEPMILPADDYITPLPATGVSSSSYTGSAGEQIYSVQKGDTLSAIASMYGTSWKKLAEYNNLSNPNRLRVGQEIRIPASSGGMSAPVKRVAAPSVTSARPAASIAQGSSYVIQRGDTLGAIAKRSGLTIAELKVANGLSSDRIVAGKSLTIPKKGAVSAPALAKPAPVKAANPEPAPAAMADLSPAPAVEPSSPSPAPASATSPVYEHVLYPGESLDDVARQYGSSQGEIMKLNNITDPASVKPGTKLLVPIPE